MHELSIVKEDLENKSECTMYLTADRRLKPRIECDYQAIVESTNGGGEKYKDDGILLNLSASGLFLILDHDVLCGSRISVTIQLTDSRINPEAPKLAINGIVVRTEPRNPGEYGIAVKFNNYRFI